MKRRPPNWRAEDRLSGDDQGGRGRRRARHAHGAQADELSRRFRRRATRPSRHSAVPDVYIEKFIERPRHIEFQMLGDRHGNVMHLRRARVFDPAPAPEADRGIAFAGYGCEDAARNRRPGGRRRSAKIGYHNAGTVEFLRDERRQLYFIEMNTRIQVEHPVTEMVTGVDLVKAQIRFAAGAKLEDVDRPVKFRGHAIECRINAEDPETFAPSPGRITAFQVPAGPACASIRPPTPMPSSRRTTIR